MPWTMNMSLVTNGADSLNHRHLAPMQPEPSAGQTPLLGHLLPSGHRSFGRHFTGGGGAESRPVLPEACCVVLYSSGSDESSHVPT